MRLLFCLVAIAAVAAANATASYAKSEQREAPLILRDLPPKIGDEEYHAHLKPLVVPGHRKGYSKKNDQHITLMLVAITDDDDKLSNLCSKSPVYRDALLTMFHADPVVLNRRGGIGDRAATTKRIMTAMVEAVGNEIVTGVRLASENVADYAENAFTCK